MKSIAILLCVVAAGLGIFAQGSPVSSPASPSSDSRSEISGQILSATTNAPLAHVQISLTNVLTRQRAVTLTDSSGRYVFGKIPAGRYSINAGKAGFTNERYGSRGTLESVKVVTIRDGRTILTNVNFSFSEAGAIEGRVTDDAGEPLVDATVEALHYQYGPYGRRLSPVAGISTEGPTRAITDDRGQYRIYGLPPGDYYVRSTQSFATQGSPTIVYSYHPGVSDIAKADYIAVRAGAVARANFTFVEEQSSGVSGVVMTSFGDRADRATLTLERTENSTDSRSILAGNDGSFHFLSVPQGQYYLRAAYAGARPGEFQIAQSLLDLTGGDVDGVTLFTQQPVRLLGRVVLDGHAAASIPLGLQVSPVSVAPLLHLFARHLEGAYVRDDGSFEFEAAGGLLIRPQGSTPEWALKAVLIEGRDVTDIPYEIPSRDVAGIEVILTNRLTRISGRVTDVRTGAGQTSTVVFVPIDVHEPKVLSRFVRSVRSDEHGRYEIKALPPADYVAIALDGLQAGMQWNPAFQSGAKKLGTRFSIAEGQSKVVDLHVIR